MCRAKRPRRLLAALFLLSSHVAARPGKAQDTLMALLRALDSAEHAKDFARARLVADAGYAISEGKPDFLIAGAFNAAKAGDAVGALDRFRRAIEAGFLQAEAAARDTVGGEPGRHRRNAGRRRDPPAEA